VGFELRALCLLSRHSTTSATSPALFVLVIFETGSHLTPRLSWTEILLLVFSYIAGMTGAHQTQPMVVMESSNFLPKAGLAISFSRSLSPEWLVLQA
jgi:hypothetical protein